MVASSHAFPTVTLPGIPNCTTKPGTTLALSQPVLRRRQCGKDTPEEAGIVVRGAAWKVSVERSRLLHGPPGAVEEVKELQIVESVSS
jgi:hypothetical protein